MLGAGYGSFFVVGFLIYRGVKKNAEYLRNQGKPAAAEHGP
jgi:hypothetical protein